jgi:hypothetical protein
VNNNPLKNTFSFGTGEGIGVGCGDEIGDDSGETEGIEVGDGTIEGAIVGEVSGDDVGWGVGEGCTVGEGSGVDDGSTVGEGCGVFDGCIDGEETGDEVGSGVELGSIDGEGIIDGSGDGWGVMEGSVEVEGDGSIIAGSSNDWLFCGWEKDLVIKSLKLLSVSSPLPENSSLPPVSIESLLETLLAFLSILLPVAFTGGLDVGVVSLSLAVPQPTLSIVSPFSSVKIAVLSVDKLSSE